MRQIRHVEQRARLGTAAEAREVGNERVEFVREHLRRRQKVPARQPEAVHVHHDALAGRGRGDSR